MKVNGKYYRSAWWDEGAQALQVIDQRWLPHDFRILSLHTVSDYATAIVEMRVRGAPLIGVTAAYGLARAMRDDPSDACLDRSWHDLHETRPTAINLRWALDRARAILAPLLPTQRASAALTLAHAIADEDVSINRRIGEHGVELIRHMAARRPKGEPVRVLTHCNAGWVATIDLGTATAPVYLAHDAGIPIHVWIDETRPRFQGALTAWELGSHGVSHSYITDNAGGHLMQHGMVDLVIVGTDRVTRRGDVCNKIGTYLKALAAFDNDVPFYVAAPSPSIDWTVDDGLKEIPIEERAASEVASVQGVLPSGDIGMVRILPSGTVCSNPGFDVTPNRLIGGLITERGICPASPDGMRALFPDLAGQA